MYVNPMLQLGITLRQLEYFVATVELGTFSAAAAHFHISQTAISLAISELERALDVQVLLRRRAKGPSLTAAGAQLLVDARQVLGHAGELQSSARGIGQHISGRLVVGSFPTITPYVMGRIIEGLPRRHPGLEIDFVEDSVEGLQQRLADGACEAALMYDIGIGPGVTTTPLYSCCPYAVLPKGHSLATRDSIRLAEIIEEPMIMIDMPPSAEFFIGLLGDAGYSPDIRHRSNSVETVRSLVGRGLGWSILIHRPVPDRSYDGTQVVGVNLEDIGGPVDVLLVRSADARPTRRVEAFTQFCRDSCSHAANPFWSG